jgi:hypothetical protein
VLDFHFHANELAVAFEDHASVFKSAAMLPALCPRIPCTVRGRFCAPVGRVASPWEIQCHRKRGI